MKKTSTFVRKFKYELIALLVNFVVISISLLTIPQFYASIIILSVFIFSTFVVIFLKTKEKDFYHIPFDSPGEEHEWVGRGDLKYIKNLKCFEITNSHEGYIFSKAYNWNDYKYSLDFKIINKSFGFIVRAKDPSNCLMYQIFNNKIRPHLRIDSQWIPSDDIKFEKSNISNDEWYKLIVICDKKHISIKISNKANIVFDRTLIIPNSAYITNKLYIENNKTTKTTKHEKIVDLNFGSVGIRNYHDESALIKNIVVEKI